MSFQYEQYIASNIAGKQEDTEKVPVVEAT